METLIETLTLKVLEVENCPYEVEVNVLLTDNEGIKCFNKQYRDIDQETDVLSFPNIEFTETGDFSKVEESVADCFEPDTGELILGDIIISVDRVLSQAVEFGHSIKREFAFLITHSLYHLCGYDHLDEQEAHIMEQKQEAILQIVGITRD